MCVCARGGGCDTSSVQGHCKCRGVGGGWASSWLSGVWGVTRGRVKSKRTYTTPSRDTSGKQGEEVWERGVGGTIRGGGGGLCVETSRVQNHRKHRVGGGVGGGKQLGGVWGVARGRAKSKRTYTAPSQDTSGR